jgi:hypothetical protein
MHSRCRSSTVATWASDGGSCTRMFKQSNYAPFAASGATS